MSDAVPDPRSFRDPTQASAAARQLHALAEGSLAAETAQRADAFERELRAALSSMLDGDGAELAAAVDGAPSVALARHLWRALDLAWQERTEPRDSAVSLTALAIPLVIVAGVEGGREALSLPAILAEPERLATILVECGALGGNRSFAFANVVVSGSALDVARLPEILGWLRLPKSPEGNAAPALRMLDPAPIDVRAASEGVHLRFLFGTAIATASADLFADAGIGKWGVALAHELQRQLAGNRASVLILPRPPQRPLPALHHGRVAQREVSAQIFASSAIRRMRGSVGEPTAVISAHCANDAPGGGELRLSLSSPFDPRGAEGFRCPLYPQERVADVVSMLVDLLRDCRVAVIHAVTGVHPDRVDATKELLLFKPDAMPAHVTLVPR